MTAYINISRNVAEQLYNFLPKFEDVVSDLGKCIAQALQEQLCSLNQDILTEYRNEITKKHETLLRYLTAIRKIIWKFGHATKSCTPIRYNYLLIWIVTGTYYHYTASDDEDSNCSNNDLTRNGLIINLVIHRTLRY